ncbi:MAG: hypothetical protein KDB63_20620 [Nocardioidaceae bacterium]|nr:hypothetical protein [Nocardioidaceae bacterium]
MSNEHRRPMVAFVAVAVICGVLLANASRSHAVDLLRHTVLPAMVAGPVLHLSDRTATAEPDPSTSVDAADEAASRPAEPRTTDRATTRQRDGRGRHGGVAVAQPESRGHDRGDAHGDHGDRGDHGEHAHDGVTGDTSWGFGGDEPTGDDGHETSAPSTEGTPDGERRDHRRHHGRHHRGGHGHGDEHGWPSDEPDSSASPEDDGSSDDGGWGDDHGHDHGDHDGHGGDHGHHGWGDWSH